MRYKLCLGIFFILGLAIILSLGEINSIDSAAAEEATVPSYFKLSVSAEKHNDYGFTYPVTFQFSIPSGSSSLEAFRAYSESTIWTQIIEKTSDDFFNGIEAVRFDYDNDKAYISVAFSDESDEIFLKIVDQWGSPVVTYGGITKYYDNRDAAVVFSADDWCGNSFIDSKFQQASDMFTLKKIWLCVGINTQGFRNDRIWGDQGPPIWSHIQGKIDEGYIEANAHSRTHPHVPYSDYDSEVGGSKDDIIDNLTLPSLYKSGIREYVWGWVSPHGDSDSTLRAKLAEYKYMADMSGPMDNQEGDFPDWDSNNDLYEQWNRWEIDIEIEQITLSKLNSEFDKRTNAGKIYHVGFHPWRLDFSPGSKIDQHTDYVKGRKNLWYVGQGALMIYHYVQEQDIVTVQEEYGLQTLEEVFSYPNPCYPEQGQVVKIANLPLDIEKIYIYTINGELVRSLEKGDEIEEGPGYAVATWDCRNQYGEEVVRGIYVYLAATFGGEKKVGKIAVLK